MKKVLNQVFIFIALLLLFGGGVPKKSAIKALFKEFDYKVSFYSLTEFNGNGLNTVNAGNFYIVTCDKTNESDIESSLNNVIGKSYKFKNYEFDLQKFILENGFKTEITQDLEDVLILYLYSGKLEGEKLINGKKINLQIAVSKNFIVAGNPVILGPF